MIYSKRMKQRVRLYFIWLAFTPFVFMLAALERGNWGVGGEIFFPIIPLLIYGFIDTKLEYERVEKK